VLPIFIAVAAVFALLLVARVGGARRYEVVERWPAVLLACAAFVALSRGALWPALALGALAALAWSFWPRIAASIRTPTSNPTAESREEADARAILGVGANATEAEIRAAYRAKMASAHPDRGGRHADAARLTAARDRLLRSRR
jgi:hypothetical protein